ncbi:MAG: dTMP kinase [Acidobacteriota bacterium]
MPPFITFEGIDGSGKTTQIRRLESYLTSKNVKVLVSREPGGTQVGEAVRQILLHSQTTRLRPVSELLLYYASRHQNLHEVILPALSSGAWVLCDRYADASMAYQGFGRELGADLIDQLNRLAIEDRMPDMTFLIDIDPRIGLDRARQRNSATNVDEGRFEKESLSFYQRVREGYLSIAAKDPRRVFVLDGTQPVDQIHDRIVQHLLPLCP